MYAEAGKGGPGLSRVEALLLSVTTSESTSPEIPKSCDPEALPDAPGAQC